MQNASVDIRLCCNFTCIVLSSFVRYARDRVEMKANVDCHKCYLYVSYDVQTELVQSSNTSSKISRMNPPIGYPFLARQNRHTWRTRNYSSQHKCKRLSHHFICLQNSYTIRSDLPACRNLLSTFKNISAL